MPLRNERGDVVLVFSGEEFPEPETPRALKDRGHALDVTGAEYLVHLAEEDASFPASLNGRFHGLLTDIGRGTAVLFNDRYGMHRLYYHASKDAFYFAAEAKAILRVRPELRRIDPRGLGELVACGCVLQDRTIFEGLHVLPCAARWEFERGTLKKNAAYFRPGDWEQQSILEPDAYYRELRETFSRNLPRYFNGREPIGLSLTGGLDTRMIMAWLDRPPRSLPCYTFGSAFRDCRDVLVARQVARACEQSHHVITVGPEFLSRFGRYAERTVFLTDGCADVSRSADLYVNEQARSIAPVRMTGNYGGEVLRRVRAFKPIEPLPDLFRQEFRTHIRNAATTYGEIVQGHPLSFALFRQAPWNHHALRTLEETQLSLRSPFLDNDFVRTVFRAPPSAATTTDVCLRLIRDGRPALRAIWTDRGPCVANGPGASTALGRFFDVERKAEYAFDYGMPQWLAGMNRVLRPCRPERFFLGRHKFYHFRVWYRDTLSGYIRDVLLDPRALSRPYLDRNTLESVVESHVSGRRNYTTELHKALTLELVHRQFIDS
jgi:asparagine synthase (glutamine-hydrolysing)